MRFLKRAFLVPVLVLVAAAAQADVDVRVPVATQVQGAVFYRTSLMIGNGSGSREPNIELRLTYRSPADGTMQNATVDEGKLSPRRVLTYDDIIQHFKDAGAIRAADQNAALFGTLRVSFNATGQTFDDSIAEARTYSPATGGGTNGIAYVGRNVATAGAQIVKAAVRNGSLGSDGNTRANIGFVNEGGTLTDVDVVYYDGTTGAEVKQFTITDLAVGEVKQYNNIFAGLPAATTKLVIRATAVDAGARISGYGVQLDNTTNDGSFFLMVEPDDGCYQPPTTGIKP